MQTNITQIINQLNNFRNSYKGDPQQQIQQMLNSGRVSQEQYNAAVKKANQLASLIGIPTH